MLTQTAEYALRATVWLAQHDGEPQTRTQIAAATKTPPDYLAKVLRELVRARVVTAERGVRGGFALADRPVPLTLLDVVNAVDPVRRIKTCPLGLPSHQGRLCPVHAKLDQAMAAIESTLGEARIASLIQIDSREPRPTPLCDVADRHACAGATA